MLPSPEAIVNQLDELAMSFMPFAVGWHVVVGVGLLLVVFRRWRPGPRELALLIVGPVISVSGLAGLQGNPFNGAVFLIFAIALIDFGRRLPESDWLRPVPRWATITGAMALAYAWFYPHFNPFADRFSRLMGSPMGIIPCPTLALIGGITLLTGGFGSRRWILTVAGVALFYSLFGIFRLGVLVDIGLLFAAVALISLSRQTAKPTPATPALQ